MPGIGKRRRVPLEFSTPCSVYNRLFPPPRTGPDYGVIFSAKTTKFQMTPVSLANDTGSR
jgi:hypothetical protein